MVIRMIKKPNQSLKTNKHTEKMAVENTKKKEVMNTVNEDEIARFVALADHWWDVESGPHKLLHALNPTRVAFIRSTLCRHFGRDISSPRPFEGLKFADVGCGGGLLCEPLAQLGATVTGIDAGDKNIEIARHHSKLDPTTSSIEFLCTTAEKLVEEKRQFDAVFSLEVIEHVEHPAEFAKSLASLIVPGGALVISTPNRTMTTYAFLIIAAEYIQRILPVGTHDWTKFIKPEELVLVLQRCSISVKEIAGLSIEPGTDKFVITDDISLDYILYGSKDNEANNGNKAAA